MKKIILSVLMMTAVFVAGVLCSCSNGSSSDNSGLLFLSNSKTDTSAKDINITGNTTVKVGEQMSLTASLTPADSTDSISWSSSNTSKATIAGSNKTAVVTGVAEGSVIITATAGNASKTITITVTANTNDENSNNNNLNLDYNDYSAGSYVVKVRNNTSKKLVAFKGAPVAENLLGGIPANATNHALKFNQTLFNASQDFILFIVTEDDYKNNKSNLSSLANYPFARLYAYYNTNSKNNIVYEISSCMGGNSKILLNNNTSYNVELRKDGIYGETIGYTGAQTINTTFKVEPGDYYVFPVFRKFDTILNEIVTVYPKYTTGKATGKAIVEYFNVKDSSTVQLDASNWSSGVTFTSGYAYIRINNQSSTGINLYNSANGTALVTSTGCNAINSGSSQTFTLQMDLNASNSTTGSYEYETSKQYSQFRVGNSLQNDYYLTGSADTTFTYEAGKIYTYTITGQNIYDLTVDTVPVVTEMSNF